MISKGRTRLYFASAIVACIAVAWGFTRVDDAAAKVRDRGPCPAYSGKVFERGRCVCPRGTYDELPPTGRCVPRCPGDRTPTCVRHDALLSAGRWDLAPGDFCDCLLRMPDLAPKPGAGPGRPIPMPHCSPFTGEVLLEGKCVCPPGTTYEPHDGYGRCLAPCPSGRAHDCRRQRPRVEAGDADATPEKYCVCPAGSP